MKHGVLFEVNGIPKHSYEHFGLFLGDVEIPFPPPKTNYIKKEGGNGTIDNTEVFGKVFYDDRKFSLKFSCEDKIRYTDALSDIVNFLHGREVKMTLYYDPLYYYKGRLSINKYASNKAKGTMVFDVVTEPYKYHQLETIAINEVKEKAVINYKNDRMEVVPIFKATDNIKFEFNGNSYSLGTTETIFPNIEFTQGDNVIVWQGNGVVEVRYQEGRL